MPYSELPYDDRHPDDAALAWFGRPVFEIVGQPELRFAGWGMQGDGNEVTLLSGRYYLADADGKFREPEPLALGDFLRGEIISEVPGATYDEVLTGDRAALSHHLAHAVTNDRIGRPGARRDFGSPAWLAELDGWRDEVRALIPVPAELEVDGRPAPGIRLSYGGYTATTAAVSGRLVTLVLYDADAARIDRRLITRPD